MKKTKVLIIIGLICGFSLLFVSCAPAAAFQKIESEEATEQIALSKPKKESEVMVFYDDLENMLEFVTYPESIVSLSPSTTEILFAVGGADQAVGRDEMSTFPQEAVEVTSVGAMWGELPIEAILALEPDLVIVAEIISIDSVTALQELGLQVYWQANPETFKDLYENIRDIAAITGNQDAVEDVVDGLQTRVQATMDIVAGAESIPSVFYELDATDPANPWTTGSGTFIDYLITSAGGTNAAGEVEGDFAAFSAEQLIAVNPDIILLGDALYGVSPESVADRAGWDVISAVINGAVYPIDPTTVSVPGPRLVDGFEAMVALIHPELFE